MRGKHQIQRQEESDDISIINTYKQLRPIQLENMKQSDEMDCKKLAPNILKRESNNKGRFWYRRTSVLTITIKNV